VARKDTVTLPRTEKVKEIEEKEARRASGENTECMGSFTRDKGGERGERMGVRARVDLL